MTILPGYLVSVCGGCQSKLIFELIKCYISYTLRNENNHILWRDLLAEVTSPFPQKIVVVGIHWHLNALKQYLYIMYFKENRVMNVELTL